MLYNVLFSIDSDIVTFCGDDRDIKAIDLNNVNLDYNMMIIMILKLWLMLDLWLGVMNINNANHLKKS